MFNFFKLFKREDRLFGAIRSSQWPRARRDWLSAHPTCAICGAKKKLMKSIEVHHVIPVNFDASKELDINNFISACRDCHFIFCHLKSWSSYNSDIAEDSILWYNKIKNRPKANDIEEKRKEIFKKLEKV